MVTRPNILCGILLIMISISASCAQMPSSPPQSTTFDTPCLPTRVAILPFVNRTSSPQAGTALRKMFYNFFSSLNYHDLEPTLIDRTLRENGLYESIVTGDLVSMQRVGQILGADALITAEVLHYGKMYAVVYADTCVRIRASMINCVSGKKLWETEHEAHSREGDVPLSLTGVAGSVIKTAISYNQASILHTAAKLCLEVVPTIPAPETMTDPPPDIDYLVHNGGHQLMRPGQRLKVVMSGDPGLKATWDIIPLVSSLAMQEPEPGTYVGSYRVAPGDRLSFGRVVGHLANPEGAASHWVDIIGPVAFGKPTVLPARLCNTTVLSPEKSPYVADSPVLVPKESTLTVQPGTVIWFKGTGLGVQGKLVVQGTPEDPVRISGLGTGEWKGILLDATNQGNILSHCRISGARFGLRGLESNVRLDHCLFADNTWNIVLEQSKASISKCLIRSAHRAGVALRATETSISDSMIVDNREGGLLLEATCLKMTSSSLCNNGRWDLMAKKVDSCLIQAAGNWWGTADDGEIRVQGQLDLSPTLDSPPSFEFMHIWMTEPF